MANDTKIHKNYLTINPIDQSWGLYVNSVGHQSISEKEEDASRPNPAAIFR